MINCHKADQAIEKNGVGSNILEWSNKNDINAYLKPLKTKEDSRMPVDRAGLENRYLMWRYRTRMDVSTDPKVLESFNMWLEEENSKKKGNTK